jgi:hypothetical protein
MLGQIWPITVRRWEMPINQRSKARIDELLENLARNNIKGSLYKRSIYRLNNQMVSIRTTTKPNPYWYDISESVMTEVDYLIYQTDSQYHFALFPSLFFKRLYNQLQDSNRPNAKQFYINWSDKTIESKPHFVEEIRNYCCSIPPNDSYGNWKGIFLNQ